MASISGFHYPLEKINMMASFLPVYGVENFGLIILDERFVAYPKYRLAHTILAHEVAQHWIGNVVTVKNWKELCLQVFIQSIHFVLFLMGRLDMLLTLLSAFHVALRITP